MQLVVSWTNTDPDYVPPTGDPYWSYVSLLLHCNGSNGSTTITDNSTNAFSPTVGSPAQISTSQSIFGGASLSFDGASAYIRYADHLNLRLGFNDFTIEIGFRPSSVTGYRCIAEHRDAFTAHGWTLFQDNSTLYFYAGNANTAAWEIGLSAASALSANNWYRAAITRIGSTWRLFLDGVEKASGTWSGAIEMSGFGTPYLTFGKFFNNSGYFSGYMDEIRISNGVGRYSAGYTLAAAEFLNS